MKNSDVIIKIFILALLSIPPVFSRQEKSKNEFLPLGSRAPDFRLKDVVSGKQVAIEDYFGKKALLIIFLCRHCPFVQHDLSGILKMAKDYQAKDVGIISISSNDPASIPEDSPESLKEMAQRLHFPMPLLFDETQETAKAFKAYATPDFYLFDKERKLVYHGQFDDSRPNSPVPVTGKDVRTAIDAVLTGSPLKNIQKQAVGCSIKWRKT